MTGPDVPGAPLAIVRQPIFRITRFRIADVGRHVRLIIGDRAPLFLTYLDAFRFSQLLRLRAKRAKSLVGDRERHWSTVEFDEYLEGESERRGRGSGRVARTRLDKFNITDVGEHVHVTLAGADPIIMTYTDALQFSQMVRTHAKRAKRAAGDGGRIWGVAGYLDGLKG